MALINNNQDSNNSHLHLVLGLSLTTPNETTTTTTTTATTTVNPYYPSSNEPSLTLGLSGESYKQPPKNITYGEELCRQNSSPNSVTISSFSNGKILHVKRERDEEEDMVEEEERVSSRIISDEDEDATNTRKKLRLTKEQSLLLEESFKLHSTLNPKQKQALAKQLSLRPRQVEVWFQNRRARTKLKQTEVDCEFLKKCCETLTDENRRLKKELQELKALKLSAQPLYMPMPAATLSICPSCDRLGGRVAESGGSNKKIITAFTMAPNSHFYNPFNNPSAAC